jgi:hypothetical protein
MRALASDVIAALASGSVALVNLIKMDFSSTPVYLNTSTWDLVWKRRYNLLTYSEQFDNAAWATTTSALTVVANAATAPDGSITADKLVYTGAVDTYRGQNVDIGVAVGGKTFTFSIWAWTDSGQPTAGQLFFYDGTVAYVYQTIIALTTVPTRYTITAVIDPAATSHTVEARFDGPNNPTAGQYCYVWGAQLEPGELASTYTPTTTTALTDPGITYKGAYGLGQISAITDKPGEAQGITLELHGADAARISLALDDSDIVQGTPISIRTAIIDTSTYQILDAPVEWVGTMDTMSIGEDGTSASISVTCESKAVDLLRGNAWMYTDADQRLVNATDGSFKYVVDQIDKPIVWPAKSFFQQ